MTETHSDKKTHSDERERDKNRYIPLREVKQANKAWSFQTKHDRKGYLVYHYKKLYTKVSNLQRYWRI